MSYYEHYMNPRWPELHNSVPAKISLSNLCRWTLILVRAFLMSAKDIITTGKISLGKDIIHIHHYKETFCMIPLLWWIIQCSKCIDIKKNRKIASKLRQLLCAWLARDNKKLSTFVRVLQCKYTLHITTLWLCKEQAAMFDRSCN